MFSPLLLVKIYWVVVTSFGLYYGALYLRDVIRGRIKLNQSKENGSLRRLSTIHLRTSILSAIGTLFLFVVGVLSILYPQTRATTPEMLVAAWVYAGAVTVVVGNMALSRRDRGILDASIREDVDSARRS